MKPSMRTPLQVVNVNLFGPKRVTEGRRPAFQAENLKASCPSWASPAGLSPWAPVLGPCTCGAAPKRLGRAPRHGAC